MIIRIIIIIIEKINEWILNIKCCKLYIIYLNLKLRVNERTQQWDME